MTTILVVQSAGRESAIREVLGSVAEAGETVHFLRSPTADRIDRLVRDVCSEFAREVEYTVDGLEGDGVSELVAFAAERDADRICLGISERTQTGKVRIDDRTQSILLHDRIAGDLVVGDSVIILKGLSYDG